VLHAADYFGKLQAHIVIAEALFPHPGFSYVEIIETSLCNTYMWF
jgi:hypothetical protein